MKTHHISARLTLFFCCFAILQSCTKKEDVKPTEKLYTTSKGGSVLITDSIKGQLGEANAEVIFKMKGSINGITFNCYDQTNVASDTTFADVVFCFANSYSNIKNGVYLDKVTPIKTEFTTKLLGIQDSIYVKVVRDPSVADNQAVGNFSCKAVLTELPIQSAETIVVNDPDYFLVNQNSKPNGSKYYEKWLKAKVTPDSTYFIQYLRSIDNGDYSLSYFNCEFYASDGITVYPGTDISKGGKVLLSSDQTYYIEHKVASGQKFLYIRCYSTAIGTNGVRVLDYRP